MGLTTVWTRRDGVISLVPVLDCGDRTLLGLGVSRSQGACTVLQPLARALRTELGRPGLALGLELRTDRGPQFTGESCRALCRSWGIRHTLAPAGRPTGNAVAERFILTLKTELLWTRDWESLEELRDAVYGWIPSYNEKRPHQALGWMTPAEKRAHNLLAGR
jgi:putative transposase